MSQSGVYTASGGGGGSNVQTITGNSGGAVAPIANNIDLNGVAPLTVTGFPGFGLLTIEINGATNHAIQIGDASGNIVSLGVAADGQIPIGSAGADPVLSTLTAGTGISIANGAGSITISSSGTSTFNYRNVNTTPYVVLTTDNYLSVDSSGGPITVELPNAATLGQVFIIKDRTGSAAANNITVTTVGGVVLIDGAASFVMNTAFESINVIGNGTSYEVF